MEFFADITVAASAEDLQRRLTIGELPRWCASISKVLGDEGSSGAIYSVWGKFDIRREVLRNGVRFSLPECPNALQWTVTTGHAPAPAHTFVHVTINRSEHDPDFVDTIRQFTDDWKAGLQARW